MNEIFKSFNLKKNSWKTINSFPNDFEKLCVSRNGVLVSNALHWLVTRKSRSDTRGSILAFDLVTEDFNWLSLPDYGGGILCYMNLVELGGWLCVVRNFNPDKEPDNLVDVWVMKEYGVKESWTKLFLVLSLSNVTDAFPYFIPVVYFKSSDQILLAQDGEKFLL